MPWNVLVTLPKLPQSSTRPRTFSGRCRYASSATWQPIECPNSTQGGSPA